MKINVDAPVKKEEIKACLLACESPKYTFLGANPKMPTQLQFEVEGQGELVSVTKGIIKSQPWGKTVVFRVLEDGKFW